MEDSLRKGSLWVIGGQFLSIALQAVYFVLMGRTLGSAEYGAFVGVVALVTVLSQFSSCGMEMVLMRNLSRDRKSFAATWGHALCATACGFVLLLLVSMSFAHFTLAAPLRTLVPWIALSDGLFGKLVQVSSRAFQGVGQLRRNAQLTTYVNFGRAALAGALSVYAHSVHHPVSAGTWARIYWVSPLTVAVIALWMVTKQLGGPAYARLEWKELSEGLSFSLSNSSISIYNDIDKTFLVSQGMTYAAGIYGAAYRVVDVATAPLYGLYTAAMPHLFRAGGKSIREAEILTNRLMRRTVPYGVLVAVTLFGTAGLLPLLFGKSFAASVTALRWLCLLPLLRVLHYAWGSVITASTSQWTRTATQVSTALLNLLLVWLLVPRWSWQGAAVASLLTDGGLVLISWLVLIWLRRRETARATGETLSAV
jgi:O-antigen/teichoic acid export membrane protein